MMNITLYKKDKSLPAIAAAIAIFYTCYKLMKSSNKVKEIPMHSSAYPYIGHLLSLGNTPSEVISKWHKELGSIIKIKMGSQTWVSVDNPKLAHQLLVINGIKTSDRPKGFYNDLYSMGRKGMIFSSPDSCWKKIRLAVSTAISPTQINKYMESIEYESKALVDRLIETSRLEDGVYPIENLQLYTMNTISVVGFGRKFNSIEEPDFKLLIDIIKEGTKYSGIEYDLITYFPIFSILEYYIGNHIKMKEFILKRRNPFFQRLINEAIESNSYNLLKYFKENHYNLSMEEMIVALNDVIGAGTDTISVTLSWNFAIMCHHPRVQLRIQEEIDRFILLHNRLPNINDKNELPLCVSVIKECMRYKPTTSFGLPHVVDKDFQIDEYIIEKGTVIIINNVNLHKNPEFYPDTPESFVPERFINNLKSMQAAVNGKFEERDHFIFGWGRRICPGISLAEAEIFSGFINVFAKCSIEPTNEGMPNINDTINLGLTLLPVSCKLNFIQRTNSLI